MDQAAYLAALKAVNTWYENETGHIAEEPARRLVREVAHALTVFGAAAERRGLERAAEVAEENAAKARSQESAGQEWRGFDAEMYEATARWLRALMDSQRDRAVTIKPP